MTEAPVTLRNAWALFFFDIGKKQQSRYLLQATALLSIGLLGLTDTPQTPCS